MARLNKFSSVTPAIKGDFTRRFLLGMIKHGDNPYPLKANHFRFNINPLKEQQFSQFVTFLQTVHAKPGKKKNLYTIDYIDENRVIHISLFCQTKKKFVSSFSADTFDFVVNYDHDNRINGVRIRYYTRFFKNEPEVSQHFEEQSLLTPHENKEEYFQTSWDRMLYGARLVSIENWILPDDIREIMFKLRVLLEIREKSIMNEKNYQVFIRIANELGEMTGIEVPFQIKLLELYRDLQWLSKLFPMQFQNRQLTDAQIFSRLSTSLQANPCLNLQVLYQVNFAGCQIFANKGKSSSEIIISDEEILRNNLPLIAMIFRMSVEYNILIPEKKLKTLIAANNAGIDDTAEFQQCWNMIVDNLSAIFLLYAHSCQVKFFLLYNSGFLTTLFPTMIKIDNPIENFIRSQLSSCDAMIGKMKWDSILCLMLAMAFSGINISTNNRSQLLKVLSNYHNQRYDFLIQGLNPFQLNFVLESINKINSVLAPKDSPFPAPDFSARSRVSISLSSSRDSVWQTHQGGVLDVKKLNPSPVPRLQGSFDR